MTKLDEFIEKIGDDVDRYIDPADAKLTFYALVKLVRERASQGISGHRSETLHRRLRNELATLPQYGVSYREIGIAFNEVVKELWEEK